jgi:hypothetical protein
MIAGLLVMTIVWGWTPIAFTWYIFIGAMTTVVVAGLLRVASGRAEAHERV